MIGYGIDHDLSAFLGTAVQARQHLGQAEPGIFFGLYGTPIETDHYDLDLFLTFDAGGAEFSQMQVVPALEFNYDLEPDLAFWGLYLRLELVGHNHQEIASDSSSQTNENAFLLGANPGTYLTVASGHQILLE